MHKRVRYQDHHDDRTPFCSQGPLEGTTIPLHSGQVTSIGRDDESAGDSDEIAAAIIAKSFSTGSLKLRDLGSRNGTRVQGEPISGDMQLVEGRQFQIGNTFISFTTEAKTRSSAGGEEDMRTDTVASMTVDTVRSESRLATEGRPEIVHLTDKTRYTSDADAISSRDRAGQEAQRLVRLGLKMGAETDVRRLSEIVLEGLFGVTSADIGAVLLYKEGDLSHQDHRKLDLVAYKSLDSRPFERVSDYVSSVALESRAAVVARDVNSDDKFKSSDSLRAMRAESIICSPIRMGDRLPV